MATLGSSSLPSLTPVGEGPGEGAVYPARFGASL
jgi:hypothetical protein